MPRGELRRELIASLRWSRDKRRSKARAPDGRGHIAEMQSIHLRPPEVADRLIPGYLEADMNKGATNLSTYTQKHLDEIAWSLKTRKSLEFRTPIAVYNELLLNMEITKSATKH